MAEYSFLSKKSKGVKKALNERLAIAAGIKNTKLKSLAVGIKPIGSVCQSFSFIVNRDRVPTALKRLIEVERKIHGFFTEIELIRGIVIQLINNKDCFASCRYSAKFRKCFAR
jgi:hypothetical protein